MDLEKLTIAQAAQDLRNKKYSSKELVEESFNKISNEDSKIGAFLSLRKEQALSEAKLADEKINLGNTNSLCGIPMGLKDNLCVEGEIATAGSKILASYEAPYSSTIVKKLKEVGVVVLGKTNMDEFAMGSSTENSAFQKTKNPKDLDRVPGGSSGGSAASVAANMVLGSLGSDTGGSIRQPAAFCGVVGFKPTYGAVSRFGLMAMASSLDQIGPFAKTAVDAELIFDSLVGKDVLDSTSSNFSNVKPTTDEIKKIKIGVPKEYFAGGLDPKVEKEIGVALEKFKANGFEIKEVSLPHSKYALSCYYIIMPAEVSANLARLDGVRYPGIKNLREKAATLAEVYSLTKGEGFGSEVKRRILLGTFVLSSGYYDAYYSKAQKVRNLITQDFEKAFQDVDVIFAPTTPTPAFKFGEKTNDPLQMYLSDIFTIPANLAGLPAISLPTREFEKGDLPIGFQLIGPKFKDYGVLGLSRWYEGN
jgi:aspartyl-tRNA(Asn)/glutamyl-tRNA(Gln) amidotransferase subunit A